MIRKWWWWRVENGNGCCESAETNWNPQTLRRISSDFHKYWNKKRSHTKELLSRDFDFTNWNGWFSTPPYTTLGFGYNCLKDLKFIGICVHQSMLIALFEYELRLNRYECSSLFDFYLMKLASTFLRLWEHSDCLKLTTSIVYEISVKSELFR